MKEKIYTIPLMDAFKSGDECPFCFIERQVEEHAITFILGSQSAYMEDDIRARTDQTGFCRHHYKKMFDYGNMLGSALMMDTFLKRLNGDLEKKLKDVKPEKASLFKKKKGPESSFKSWVRSEEESCYICNHFNDVYPRYVDTFFELVKTNEDFWKLIEDCKGFCLPHFGDLMDGAGKKLNEKQQKKLIELLKKVMLENMARVKEDVSWFIDKYDYRNRDADWKNSKDAVQRGMQKIAGGHPADPVFMADR